MEELAEGAKWKVQVHGEAGSKSFEISVINSQAVDRVQIHYGWFDERKLLITHNGGPCSWPLKPIVWDRMIKLAQEVADELNGKEP